MVHVTMIKPYRKENDVYVIKEVDNEKHELQYWEGRGEPHYNPEDVKISHTLTPERQDEVRALLQKYKQVFSNKPCVVKGVVHKIDTGDAPLQAVTPYRVTGPYVAKVHQELDEMLKEKNHCSFI